MNQDVCGMFQQVCSVGQWFGNGLFDFFDHILSIPLRFQPLFDEFEALDLILKTVVKKFNDDILIF